MSINVKVWYLSHAAGDKTGYKALSQYRVCNTLRARQEVCARNYSMLIHLEILLLHPLIARGSISLQRSKLNTTYLLPDPGVHGYPVNFRVELPLIPATKEIKAARGQVHIQCWPKTEGRGITAGNTNWRKQLKGQFQFQCDNSSFSVNSSCMGGDIKWLCLA